MASSNDIKQFKRSIMKLLKQKFLMMALKQLKKIP